MTQFDPTIFGYQDFFSTTLSADITAATLTIGLVTVPTPTSGILVINPSSTTAREIIFYNSKGASNITCPSDGRGFGGTSAVANLTGTTVIMADVAEFFKGLSNGQLSLDPLRTSMFFDFIVSGGIVAQSAGLVGTFSNIVFYLNGRQYTSGSIANHTYTASKDTYVDITGNSDGTVTVQYNEVANNAASPALTTNYLRVAIVPSNGTAITLVNQGSPSAGSPTVSGSALNVTDSLGNLINPRDPMRKLLGYRSITGNFSSGTTSETVITGLTVACIIPTGRNIKATIWWGAGGSAGVTICNIRGGTTTGGTQYGQVNDGTTSNGIGYGEFLVSGLSGFQNFVGTVASTSGNPTIGAGTQQPAFVKIELE